jgi:DNA invertase Pin-like site-specific DNA recombinase
MNAIIYCRVSSKEQIEGTSLESQEAACRDYAQSKGMRVLRVFVEQGESAKFADRTELLELIDFCKGHKGEAQVLLVWKIDRFARNTSDYFNIKAILLKYGVRVVSVTEPIDENPEGKLLETILAGFAQFDNDVRAMRTVQGMRRRIQEGILPWGPPYGYKSPFANGEKKNLPDLPDQPAFDLLRRAWKLFATGAYTQAEMGRLMESWGLASAHGGSFGPQSLYQLFTNPYYKGVLVDPWDGQEYEGKHPPMVTKEEFALVQQVIAHRNRSVPHQKDRPEFPLRGFARCTGCRYPVTGAFSHGRSRSYAYYLCQRASCSKYGKSQPVGHVHEEFEGFLDSVAPRPAVLERIGDYLIEEVKEYQAELAARSTKRKVQGEQLDRELQELIRMRAQSLITDQEFLRQRKLVTDQRDVLLGKVPARSVDVAEVREKFQEIAEPLIQLRQTWQTIQPPYRRRFERLLLPAGFVIGQTRTAELGGLFSFFQGFAHADSLGVPLRCLNSNRIIPEIRDFWEVFRGIEEEKRTPRWRFKCSHRNRPPMRKLNQRAQ